jgi:hypothetical protein
MDISNVSMAEDNSSKKVIASMSLICSQKLYYHWDFPKEATFFSICLWKVSLILQNPTVLYAQNFQVFQGTIMIEREYQEKLLI